MKKNSQYCLLLQITLLIFCLMFFSCKLDQEKNTAQQLSVMKIKDLSDLATVEYTISKIIKASDDSTWYKLGDRKLLMSCEARIKAGISLDEIDEKEIEINGSGIKLKLPPAKLIYINISPDKIKEAYSEIGMFRSDFSIKEKEVMMQYAETEIQKEIKDIGVLDEAEKNTRIMLTSWLKLAGFKDIQISFKKA